MSKFDEQIIVVPRKVLFNDEKNAFNGFLHKNNIKGKDIFNALNEYEVKDVEIWKRIPHLNSLFHIVY